LAEHKPFGLEICRSRSALTASHAENVRLTKALREVEEINFANLDELSSARFANAGLDAELKTLSEQYWKVNAHRGELSDELAALRAEHAALRREWESACERDRNGQHLLAEARAENARLKGHSACHLCPDCQRDFDEVRASRDALALDAERLEGIICKAAKKCGVDTKYADATGILRSVDALLRPTLVAVIARKRDAAHWKKVANTAEGLARERLAQIDAARSAAPTTEN
jgi:predicted nuclease with TOPRIM domain